MKIAVLDDYANVSQSLADWSGLGEVTVFTEPLGGPDAVIAALAPFEVVCVMRERTPLPEKVITALPKLRLIVTTASRNLAIDVDAARARGITVCGTESRKTTTSELAIGMILALNRRLIPEAASLNAGGWQTGLGRDLAGLTLGLVGLGSIGAQMVTIGRMLGMEIAAWSANLTEGRCAELGVTRHETLNGLMSAADVVSVHLVLSQRTRGLFGAPQFAAMRDGAVFVNTSRGPIVDTDALLAALRDAPGRRAALDVFDIEPLPEDHPLRDRALIERGQLLLTPHLGYVTETTWRLFYSQTVEAIRAFADGNPIRLL